MSESLRPIDHFCQNDGAPLGAERETITEQHYLDAFLAIDLRVDPTTAAVSGVQKFIYSCSGCGERETNIKPRGYSNNSDALSWVIPYQEVRGFVPKLDPDQARAFHDGLGNFVRYPVSPVRSN